ncbi:MAG: PKD domain-containing protein, partial [Bacteroidetes bacterium]|nr:PKD domain-containing protein [Bacteroidota bacterium]
SPQFWNWDFGNNALSNLQNPTIVYDTPGVYTVTLVVRNANGPGSITKTNYITVFPSPSSSFIVNSNIGCSPSTFQFTDKSTDPAGNIVKWTWTFSDGTTSSAQNPTKSFSTVGFYDVFLTVVSSTGCAATNGVTRYIRIVPGVKADFVDTLPTICRPPFPVRFHDQSSAPGNLTYTWDFGNSTGSAAANPLASYAAAGTYTVKLTVQSNYGCSGSVQKTVTLAANNAAFNSPDSVCANSPVNFQNTSAPPATTTLWKFGDGSQSTQTSPSKTYSAPGTYSVQMIGSYPSCTDTATKQIVVRTPPVVDFTSPKSKSCKPFTVSFSDISPDAVSWQWNFGDGGTGTGRTPTHTYGSVGQYDVSLTITDSKGCQNTITKTNFVEIIAPIAVISNVPNGGCAPYTFSPVSGSVQIDGIASYTWDFGDAGAPGNNATGPTPSFTYTNTGNYTVSLTVVTNDGCTSTTSIPNAIKVGTHSVVDFSKDLANVCHSSTVTFTNNSTPLGNPVTWLFGDGTTSTNTASVSHQYADTGSFTVRLINVNNGCPDTATKTAFIQVLPPIADFTHKILNCALKAQVTFADSSVLNPAAGAPGFKWEFGDPAASTATGSPVVFNYP